VDLGDAGEFESISRFIKGRPGLQEGKRLVKDIHSMQAIDDLLLQATPSNCKHIFHIGNHENRLKLFMEENPVIEGMIEEIHKPRRNVEVIPHGKFSHIGKLMFHHGDRKGYMSINHAKQMSQLGRSIMYGHHHSIQRYTHETLTKEGHPDRHGAFGIGCLCILDRDWNYNQRVLWQQSIGFVYFQDNGDFCAYNIDITNGRAIWNGKAYRG